MFLSSSLVGEALRGIATLVAMVGGGCFFILLGIISVEFYLGRRKMTENQLGSELRAVLLRGVMPPVDA